MIDYYDYPKPDELYGAREPVAAIYCDGGVMGSSRSTEGGAWAYCLVTAKNIATVEASGLLFPTPEWPDITNNYTEYVAALKGLMAVPDGWSGTLYTDSAVTAGRIAQGWQTNGLPPKLVKLMQRELARLGEVKVVVLDGHPTREHLHTGKGSRGNPVSLHNVWCDNECTRIMDKWRVKGESSGG